MKHLLNKFSANMVRPYLQLLNNKLYYSCKVPYDNEIWYTTISKNKIDYEGNWSSPGPIFNEFVNNNFIMRFENPMTYVMPFFNGYEEDLESIILPNSIKEISYNRFYNCESLKTVILPNSVITLSEYCFSNCSSLKEIELPSSIINIEAHAFQNTNIENIEIPENIEYIGDDAFNNTPWYNNIYKQFTAGVNYINNVLFFYKGKKSSITNFNIKEGTVSIGDSVFSNAYNLTSINIPDSVKQIGNNAFSSCESLETVDLHNVYKIRNGSFSDCISLISINMPFVEEIQDGAFSGCESLETVFLPITLKKVGYGVFDNNTKIKYAGTKEQFMSIEGSYYIYGQPQNQEIECSDGILEVK